MSQISNPNPPEEVVVRGVELRFFMLLKGLRDHPPAITGPFVFGAVTYPGMPELVAALEAHHARYALVGDLEKQLEKARKNREDKHQLALTALEDAESFLGGAIGRRNPDLKKYGFKPKRKRREATVAEKAEAAAKAKATREKRRAGGQAPGTPT